MDEMDVPLYSIGYGNRPVESMISILKQYEISYLVDVRSIPASKYHRSYNKKEFAIALAEHGIRYVFMGDSLGGRPNDPNCYVDGKVDYTRCKETSWFKEGINRLKTAWDKRLSVAIMCSESKPEMCHRSKLIGQELAKLGITMLHIDERALIKSQSEVISALVGNTLPLENSDLHFTSRKRYNKSTTSVP